MFSGFLWSVGECLRVPCICHSNLSYPTPLKVRTLYLSCESVAALILGVGATEAP